MQMVRMVVTRAMMFIKGKVVLVTRDEKGRGLER